MLSVPRLTIGRLQPVEGPSLVPLLAKEKAVLRSGARHAVPADVLDRAIRSYEEKLSRTLEAMHPRSPELLGLMPAPGAEKIAGGTKPMFELEARDGSRFLLKAAPPELVDAEILGYEIARALERPAVPAVRCEIDVEGGGRVSGVLRPKLEFDPTEQLPTDTRAWSPLQREVMLRGHPLEWLLDNLDGHEGQYALLDGIGYPLNIDWDRALEHEGTTRLSRHSKHRPWLPNLKNFLYADYVSGRIDLDFSGMLREAERIRDLPLKKFYRRLYSYAESRGWSDVRRDRFVDRMIHRKQNIVPEFTAFVQRLESEREARTGLVPGKGWSVWSLLARSAKDGIARVEQQVRLSPLGDSLREMSKRQAAIGRIDWSSEPVHGGRVRRAEAPKDALFHSRLPLPFDAIPSAVQDGLLSLDGDLLDTADNEVVDVVLMPDGQLFGAARDSSSPPTHAWLAGGGPVAAAAEMKGEHGKLVELSDHQTDYPLSEAHFAQLLDEITDRKVAIDHARVLTNRR